MNSVLDGIFRHKLIPRSLVVELDASIFLYMYAFLIASVNRYMKPVCYLVALSVTFFTRNLYFPFIFGLLVSELATNNVFSWIQSKRLINYSIQTSLCVHILGIGAFLPQTEQSMVNWYLSISYVPAPGEYLHAIAANRIPNSSVEGDFVRLSIAIAILLLLELNVSMQALFSTRALRVLGKYSFGFYCLHCFAQASPGVYLLDTLYAWNGRTSRSDAGVVNSCVVFALLVLYLCPLCILFSHTADAGGVAAGRYANTVVDPPSLSLDRFL